MANKLCDKERKYLFSTSFLIEIKMYNMCRFICNL